MKHWLWGVAEKADWVSLPPRKFWSWLLRRLDRAHGHHLEYEDYEVVHTPSGDAWHRPRSDQ